VSWRLIFFINLPVAGAVAWISLRHVPQSIDPRERNRRLDLLGAALAASGLAGVTYAFTEAQGGSLATTGVVAPGVFGLLALAGFVVRERLTTDPMVPLGVFSSPQFSAANLLTFLIYAALSRPCFSCRSGCSRRRGTRRSPRERRSFR
jgi:hypothetical protein